MMTTLPFAYFHGMPGGPGEWAINAPPALREAAWLADRNDPAQGPDSIAAQLATSCPQGVRLIGFSAGAFVALQVATRLRGLVRDIHLVSPAAPLQLGQFLPQMVGGPIFRLAADRPRLFALVVRAERLLARLAPRFLLRRLLATAQGDDRALAGDPHFIAGMAEVLRQGLGRDARGFEAEVRAYVTDWRAALKQIEVPATIWQGDADNWTPPAMGRALHAALRNSKLEILPGCSHYSALRAALARIA